MNNRPRAAFMLVLQAAVVILCLSACAATQTNIVIPEDVSVTPASISNEIPLRVGLYLSPNLRSYNIRYYYNKFHQGYICLGDALANNSQNVANNIFERVVVLGDMEGGSDKYDVIMTPEVKEMSMRLIHSGFLQTKVRAVFHGLMKWTIVSRRGKEIYTDVIKSKKVELPFHYGIEKEGFVLVLEDLFQKAQQSIASSAWWKTQWWKRPSQ